MDIFLNTTLAPILLLYFFFLSSLKFGGAGARSTGVYGVAAMKKRFGLLLLVALLGFGCGGGTTNVPRCFECPPNAGCLDRDAIFVANTGSSSVSAFQAVDFSPGYSEGGVCGSPFAVNAPPSASGGGFLFAWLLVLSQAQKSISMYSVDLVTSVLTGPLCTVTTHYTPVAVAGSGGFFYVANAEGNISAYEVSGNGTVATELAGSPFPAGSGPVALAASGEPALLYVANSQSNNVSGYSLDDSTGVPTPLPGSPYAAGQGPTSIVIAPAPLPNFMGPTLVMVANRVSNSVSVFSISGNGSLSPVPGSPFPVSGVPSSVTTDTNVVPLKFAYVTIPASNEIAGYSIDQTSGALTPLAGSPFPAGVGPSSAATRATLLYVANTGSNSMSVYTINQGSGAIAPVSGSPFPVGQAPGAILYFEVPQ
jgi:6-phosphogluconolactonase (cycloisomerase 2 family)